MTPKRVVDFVLPYPPSVNSYWRHARGRHYLSRAAKNYRELVALSIPKGVRFDREIEVFVEVRPPDHRRRDIDNVLKAILDVLEFTGLIADDFLVSRIEIVRGEVVPRGECHVIVSEV
jgi:crossover junction endodeoxyribonuclease RusA